VAAVTGFATEDGIGPAEVAFLAENAQESPATF
jgi:hypothetical protein